uniref:Uncharacterized protein n=1 Tax=Anguilla anguilla TaxID=7936 RepID=A0A0E9PKI3_ANGAN
MIIIMSASYVKPLCELNENNEMLKLQEQLKFLLRDIFVLCFYFYCTYAS